MQSVTISEAARRLGVSTKTIRRRIAAGELEAHKASGPGGFVYRVTDPSVLVIPAGVDTPARPVDRRDTPNAKEWVRLVESLVMQLREVEVRAALAERELERLRRPLPASATEAVPARWWRRWWNRHEEPPPRSLGNGGS